MNLEDQLSEAASLSRLNAIDSAYIGNPTRGSNFQVRWQGYNSNGQAVVKFENNFYSARNLGNYSIIKNKPVMLRVSRGLRNVNY